MWAYYLRWFPFGWSDLRLLQRTGMDELLQVPVEVIPVNRDFCQVLFSGNLWIFRHLFALSGASQIPTFRIILAKAKGSEVSKTPEPLRPLR